MHILDDKTILKILKSQEQVSNEDLILLLENEIVLFIYGELKNKTINQEMLNLVKRRPQIASYYTGLKLQIESNPKLQSGSSAYHEYYEKRARSQYQRCTGREMNFDKIDFEIKNDILTRILGNKSK